MGKTWIKERKRDFYYKQAKKENYRSRAAYKLIQAVKKYNFIKQGDVVVDIGAAPGGWLQAVRKIVGDEGFVLGVDLKPIQPLPEVNIQTLIGDINETETVQNIINSLPRKAKVVLSDVSPNISGIWEIDHARQIDLAEKSLRIAAKTLEDLGSFYVKIFQGDLLNQFRKKLKRSFKVVKFVKPKASKQKSSELYVLSMGYKRSSGLNEKDK